MSLLLLLLLLLLSPQPLTLPPARQRYPLGG
jgi:hypothetical protein